MSSVDSLSLGSGGYLCHLTRYIEHSETPRVKVSSDPCAWCYTDLKKKKKAAFGMGTGLCPWKASGFNKHQGGQGGAFVIQN